MAEIPDAAAEHYRQVQRLQVLAVKAGRRSWAKIDPRFISESWDASLHSLLPVVSGVQFQAATSGAEYGAAALAAQGSWVAPTAFVDPESFAGFAPDGRSLQGLLYSPATTAKGYIGGGMSPAAALSQARGSLDTILRMVTTDTARQASSVDIACRQGVGYVRMLNPPSCPNCVVLAGRFYRWNAGFNRHPKDDCIHVPSSAGSTQKARDAGLIDDPYTHFAGMDAKGQDAFYGPGRAQAIRDGADISQVVNSSRGSRMTTLAGHQLRTTTEGMGKRGYARSVMGNSKARLTPDSIYEIAKDREDAVRLLEHYGYILPGGQNPLGSIVGQREGFGALGRGGTRKAAAQAVLDARSSGIRDPNIRATMTAAERRMYDAEQRWGAVLQGRNPYSSPAFGNTPDLTGRIRGFGASSASGKGSPLTPEIAASVEKDYRRWLSTKGEVFPR